MLFSAIVSCLLLIGHFEISSHPLHNSPQDVIRDHKSSLGEVLRAIEKLNPAKDTASLWAHVGNSSKYSPTHRGICTVELFRRHIHPGMKLSDVASLMRGATWLKVENIHQFRVFVTGVGHLKGDPNVDSIFSIIISSREPARAIYLSIEGDGIDRKILAKALQSGKDGGLVPHSIGQRTLLDVWPQRTAAKK